MGREPSSKKQKVSSRREIEEAETKRDQDEEAKIDPQELEVWDMVRVVKPDETITCRYDGCETQAVAIWATDVHPNDVWPMCQKCQSNDFGEETVSEAMALNTTPPTTQDSQPEETAGVPSSPKENNAVESIVLTPSPSQATPTPEEDATEDNTEEGDDDVYEISQIIPLEKLRSNPVKCHYESCSLPACTIYTSPSKPKKWYYCIDCQQQDFGGWPPSTELPVDYLEEDHLKYMTTKCSKKKHPVMPTFANNSRQPHTTTAAARPCATITPPPKPTKSKLSAAFVARHEKWQADAKKMGVDRIIVKTAEAKNVVFEALYDAFRPMNFNDIYTALKKMVPPPVLKATLEDMSMDFRDDTVFGASDEDEEKDASKANKRKEPYAGSLTFKAGKSVASNLYYTDHNKIQEMDPEARRDLADQAATARNEHERLRLGVQKTISETHRLLSEPKNGELVGLLTELEATVGGLQEAVNDAKALVVNEGHKKKLQRQIQSMAAHYRKRKNLCCSFLASLEEVSDGTISQRKCLNGDGPIALDSDETINKSAVAYAQSKKKAKTTVASLADETFVGVVLDSQGMVLRVYTDNDVLCV